MQLELLTIGTELLLGQIVDTNGAELGRALAGVGVRVTRRTTVPDEPGDLRRALTEALDRTGAVLTTGGLGPTSDDVTKTVAADLLQMPLEFRQDVWSELFERYKKLGRVLIEQNRCQADIPRGATILPNRWGTAPGLWLERDGRLVIMLPGVPHEMRNLLRHEVLPRLSARRTGPVIQSRTLRTFGIAESALAERLKGIEAAVAPLTLAYLPGPSGVDLRLTAWELPPEEARERLEAGFERLRAGAGDRAYGEEDQDLAATVIEDLRVRQLHLAVAESCTGGGVGHRVTAIPGSSDVFLGGVIAYEDRVKVEQLGVPAELIARHGAVSEPVAQAMADGVALRLGADAAIAVTGIAGPAGGSDDKPVGLVFTAILVAGVTTVHRYVYVGGRADIRGWAAQGALFMLHRRLVEQDR
jgi:competence/damage-inducible protein CinA-like protein